MTHIIAHRGVRNEAPENTIESLTGAISLSGLHGVEFDVELANEPVVLHQESMVPNSAFTAVEPAVRDYRSRDWVSEHTATAITNLDAGSWMSSEFSHVKVPLLSHVLELDWHEKHIFMELKDPSYWSKKDLTRPKKIVQAILPFLSTYRGGVSVISFNPDILWEARRVFGNTPRVLALWTEWQNRAAEAIDTAKSIGADTVSLPDQMLLSRPAWVSELHDAALEVHVYPISPTVDEADYENWTAESRRSVWMFLLDLCVDGIITDFPRELLEMIGKGEG